MCMNLCRTRDQIREQEHFFIETFHYKREIKAIHLHRVYTTSQVGGVGWDKQL